MAEVQIIAPPNLCIRTPTVEDPLRVLALGAGVQSSFLFLASAEGVLPKLDCAIFADTRYEPSGVYTHLEWLEEVGRAKGIPIIRCGVGDLRQDAIDFRQDRVLRDGKRWASVPFFVKNADGSRGQIRRQCTPTYKIEPMERVMRELLLGVARGRRGPREPLIEEWLGISADEGQRCKPPGVWRKKVVGYQLKMFGEDPEPVKKMVWCPLTWKVHAYPLCRWTMTPDRRVLDCLYLNRQHQRQDCLEWLHKRFPGRPIPRSACVGCPYRSNEEWRKMRDEDPASWEEALEFDRQIRVADYRGQVNRERKNLVGLPFVHDSLIPLDQVDLSVDDGKRGAGCGILRGMGAADSPGYSVPGMCGV